MARAIILVLDSFGVGATEDAVNFGDAGANTFYHIAEACDKGQCEVGRSGTLKLPNLAKLGLGFAGHDSSGLWAPGFSENDRLEGLCGYAQEMSSGKDTPSGHWELAGVPVLFDWGYFDKKEQTFPEALIEKLVERTGIPGILGNCHSSGTDILVEHGEEHMASGKPICYTSADSVFQVAAHEQTFGLERLMEVCEVARELVNEYNIGRVIARPFIGTQADNFERTGNRRDLAVPPPADTLLDKLTAAGGEVVSIGKIADIYAHRGISRKYKANGLDELVTKTLEVMHEDQKDQHQLIFTNLVDFDMLYGHRRDINGYAKALETFDAMLPKVQAAMRPGDLLVLTADHGCDPSWPGSDHTREHIPVLISGSSVAPGRAGLRDTFADVGQTLAQHFSLAELDFGSSLFEHQF